MSNSKSPNVHAVIAPPPSPVSDAPSMGIRVTRVITQTSERTYSDADAFICTPLSNEPWTLCLVSAGQIESLFSNRHQIQSALGIYIGEKCGGGKFYEIAVDPSYIPLLQLHGVKCDFDYDPARPVDTDVRVHGKWYAKIRAETRFLRNAAKAIRGGRDRGLELCYWDIARSHGLGAPLEQAILGDDISESTSQVRRKFAQLLLIIGLSLLEDYDNPAAREALDKDEEEILQVIQGDPRCADVQTIALARLLLEFSGGKANFSQHNFDEEYTLSDNANLYGSLIGITGTNSFGNLSVGKMMTALLKSNVFTTDEVRTLDIAELSRRMMEFLPIGFSSGYLNLPANVLNNLGWGEVGKICNQIVRIYRSRPSLKKADNDAFVLLTWSSAATGKALQVLSEWAASNDGLELSHHLIRDLLRAQTIEQLALSLAALLCHKRLLPYAMDDSTDSINGTYLADFNIILSGKSLRNERAVLERMVLSFLRVLGTFANYHDITQFLTIILNKATPILDHFDGYSDQYWVRRVENEATHDDALEGTGIRRVMGAIQELGIEEDDWTMLQVLEL